MKKIIILLIIMLQAFIFTSCKEKASPAEIVILNTEKQEEVLQVQATEDATEVKNILNQIVQYGVFEKFTFNGALMNINVQMKGNLDILNENEEKTNIDLGFDVQATLNANFNRYRAKGNMQLQGYTNTNSPQLVLNTKYGIQGNVTNDENYLFIDGKLFTGETSGNAKKKVSIQSFTEEYKHWIVGSTSLLQNYRYFLTKDNMNSYVDEYHITIASTTKDTFVLNMMLPSTILDDTAHNVSFDITMDAKRLLPLSVKLNADKAIAEVLFDKYVDIYLTENIHINDASFNLMVDFEYGNYDIKELNEEEKNLYTIFTLDGLL